LLETIVNDCIANPHWPNCSFRLLRPAYAHPSATAQQPSAQRPANSVFEFQLVKLVFSTILNHNFNPRSLAIKIFRTKVNVSKNLKTKGASDIKLIVIFACHISYAECGKA
jgi:hypothetical protein